MTLVLHHWSWQILGLLRYPKICKCTCFREHPCCNCCNPTFWSTGDGTGGNEENTGSTKLMYNLKLTQLAHLRLLDTNSNCSNTALQKDYQGTRATTRGRITCQSLSKQSPHKHISTQSKKLEWVATQPNLCFFWSYLTVCCDEVLAFHQTIAVILIMHLRESGVTLLTLTNAGTNSVSPNVTCSNIALQRDYQGTQATLRVQITCQSWSE